MRPLKFVSAPQNAKHYFYWSILTADDSIKCRCANSSMTGQVGGFQNSGVCLQKFPSFLPHPLPALLLLPFFVQSLIYSCSSFFAPKPHGNACYRGYLVCHVTKILIKQGKLLI